MIRERLKTALINVSDELLGVKPASPRVLFRSGAIAACFFGFIIACVDPEPTSSLSFEANVLIWISYFALGAALLIGTTIVATILGLKPYFAVVTAILAGPLLIAPFSLIVEYIADAESTQAFEEGRFVGLYVNEVLEVAPVAIAIGSLMAWLAFRTGQLAKGYRLRILDKFRPEPKLQELFPEVPDRFGADLIRVEAQDHYVNFVCEGGTATIKLGFSDAQNRLKPLRGLQCHRSHWVRLRHVTKIERAGSAYKCKMSNGDTVPISRRRYSEMKAQK